MSGITDLEDPNTVHYEVNIFLFFLNHNGKYKKGHLWFELGIDNEQHSLL